MFPVDRRRHLVISGELTGIDQPKHLIEIPACAHRIGDHRLYGFVWPDDIDIADCLIIDRCAPFGAVSGIGRQHAEELCHLQLRIADHRIIDRVPRGFLDILGPRLEGQAIMVRIADGFESVDDLANATICLVQNRELELFLVEILPNATNLIFDDKETLEVAFVAESCDGWIGEARHLAERQANYAPEAGGPNAVALLPIN